MNELEELWPDDDRRDGALERLAITVNGARGIATKPTAHELRLVTCRSHGLGVHGTCDALGLGYEAVKSSLRLASRRVGAKDTPHLIAICLREGWIT